MDFHKDELDFLQSGGTIIGIDEVGRGSLAGPISAAACVITPYTYERLFLRDYKKTPIRDSKKLSPLQRQKAFSWLQDNFDMTYIQIEADEIDKIGIQKANNHALYGALERAILKAGVQPIAAFVDHFTLQKPHMVSQIISATRGDSLYASVACASIWAKVTRDTHMSEIAELHPHYGWESNVGYGTQRHIQSIYAHGISPHHRKSFLTKMKFFYSTEV